MYWQEGALVRTTCGKERFNRNKTGITLISWATFGAFVRLDCRAVYTKLQAFFQVCHHDSRKFRLVLPPYMVISQTVPEGEKREIILSSVGRKRSQMRFTYYKTVW
jgi:hypothetical protein